MKTSTICHFPNLHLPQPWNDCTPPLCKPKKISYFHYKQPDHIVYATIEEAQAGNVGDVEKHLIKLKQDLKIGEEGFPTRVVIGGDQQTYAIIK